MERNGPAPAVAGSVAGAKSRHVRILFLPIENLLTPPENDKLYKPIAASDTGIRELAENIRAKGIREPLVVTLDNYILSGNRRRFAARLAGLKEVPCRIEPIRRGDPEFIQLLTDFNRQRVKTTAEVAREEVVRADPEDAYQALVEHRLAKAQVEVETIVLGEVKSRCWRRCCASSKQTAPSGRSPTGLCITTC